MNHKEIIIYLIQQEFKYAQLIFGLERLGLIYEDNTFSLLEVFQPILGIPAPENRKFAPISDLLSNAYCKWLDKAMIVEVGKEEEFVTLAESCYDEIIEIIKQEIGTR